MTNGVRSNCSRPIKIILHVKSSLALIAESIVPMPDVSGTQFIMRQNQAAQVSNIGYKPGLVQPQHFSSVKQVQS